MFVGETGCWLVVFGLSLYRRSILKQPAAPASSSSASAGYQPVRTSEDDDDDDDDDAAAHGSENASIHSATALNGGGKPHSGRDGALAPWRVRLLLALPALCDICGTTLMNAGLLLVAASIYQMTRGALVLFVGLFSVLFLRRRLRLFQWLSLLGVVLGVALVGLAGVIYPDARKLPAAAAAGMSSEAVRAAVGVFMIAGAQVFTATQFVLEEWILERSTMDPVRVVGWEGLFGFLVTLLGMVVLHLAVGRTAAGRYGAFDMVEGWRQFWDNTAVFISSILIMISIGCVFFSLAPMSRGALAMRGPADRGHLPSGFNFFGLSVTRNVSATSRSTIDTCRTLFIWVVSLGLGWETFKWLQVAGFALLVYFTFLFNGLVQPPFTWLRVAEVEELLPEEPIEHV